MLAVNESVRFSLVCDEAIRPKFHYDIVGLCFIYQRVGYPFDPFFLNVQSNPGFPLGGTQQIEVFEFPDVADLTAALEVSKRSR